MLNKLFSMNFWFPLHQPGWLWALEIVGGLWIGWKLGQKIWPDDGEY